MKNLLVLTMIGILASASLGYGVATGDATVAKDSKGTIASTKAKVVTPSVQIAPKGKK